MIEDEIKKNISFYSGIKKNKIEINFIHTQNLYSEA